MGKGVWENPERVLSPNSPTLLAPPIPQWGPSAACAWAPVRRPPPRRRQAQIAWKEERE